MVASIDLSIDRVYLSNAVTCVSQDADCVTVTTATGDSYKVKCRIIDIQLPTKSFILLVNLIFFIKYISCPYMNKIQQVCQKYNWQAQAVVGLSYLDAPLYAGQQNMIMVSFSDCTNQIFDCRKQAADIGSIRRS